VEALLGRIFDNLYGGGKRTALELAQIGQIAENTYFGKPCGLEDQIACAVGGAVAIDFGDPAHPLIQQIHFEPETAGYALCVVDTHGSHADLTPDYAAIPGEMKAVAGLFGKEVLRELDLEQVLDRAAEIRTAVGDRALLRAIHFFNENRLVEAMLAALENRDVEGFLDLVNQSGASSVELLQNIYSPKQPAEQGISTALALTRNFIAARAGGAGACRVHGGGFAGTIQAYIPLDCMAAYRRWMEGVFGAGAVASLRIRPVGAAELSF
jgi:galactokinase